MRLFKAFLYQICAILLRFCIVRQSPKPLNYVHFYKHAPDHFDQLFVILYNILLVMTTSHSFHPNTLSCFTSGHFFYSPVLISPIEFALQAAPRCHGAGDSKTADVPLGGERPHCYLPSFIMYKFDVQLPLSR